MLSARGNFHECYKLDCVRVTYNVLCDPIIINYKCNLKCIFINKFENKVVDIREVIITKAAVHGLRYANFVPFLVIVK